MFPVFNECTRISNSPSSYVLDLRTTLSKLKVAWKFNAIFKVPFMNFFHVFFILSLSICKCFFEFYWIKSSHFTETKIYIRLFFDCYLVVPQPTLSYYWGDSLTHPILTTAFLHFWPEGHQEPHSRGCIPTPSRVPSGVWAWNLPTLITMR